MPMRVWPLSSKTERMKKLEPSTTITTASSHGMQAGQAFTIHVPRPWWQRVWRWLTRQKDPVYFVTGVTDTVVNFKTPRADK